MAPVTTVFSEVVKIGGPWTWSAAGLHGPGDSSSRHWAHEWPLSWFEVKNGVSVKFENSGNSSTRHCEKWLLFTEKYLEDGGILHTFSSSDLPRESIYILRWLRSYAVEKFVPQSSCAGLSDQECLLRSRARDELKVQNSHVNQHVILCLCLP